MKLIDAANAVKEYLTSGFLGTELPMVDSNKFTIKLNGHFYSIAQGDNALVVSCDKKRVTLKGNASDFAVSVLMHMISSSKDGDSVLKYVGSHDGSSVFQDSNGRRFVMSMNDVPKVTLDFYNTMCLKKKDYQLLKLCRLFSSEERITPVGVGLEIHAPNNESFNKIKGFLDKAAIQYETDTNLDWPKIEADNLEPDQIDEIKNYIDQFDDKVWYEEHRTDGSSNEYLMNSSKYIGEWNKLARAVHSNYERDFFVSKIYSKATSYHDYISNVDYGVNHEYDNKVWTTVCSALGMKFDDASKPVSIASASRLSIAKIGDEYNILAQHEVPALYGIVSAYKYEDSMERMRSILSKLGKTLVDLDYAPAIVSSRDREFNVVLDAVNLSKIQSKAQVKKETDRPSRPVKSSKSLIKSGVETIYYQCGSPEEAKKFSLAYYFDEYPSPDEIGEDTEGVTMWDNGKYGWGEDPEEYEKSIICGESWNDEELYGSLNYIRWAYPGLVKGFSRDFPEDGSTGFVSLSPAGDTHEKFLKEWEDWAYLLAKKIKDELPNANYDAFNEHISDDPWRYLTRKGYIGGVGLYNLNTDYSNKEVTEAVNNAVKRGAERAFSESPDPTKSSKKSRKSSSSLKSKRASHRPFRLVKSAKQYVRDEWTVLADGPFVDVDDPDSPTEKDIEDFKKAFESKGIECKSDGEGRWEFKASVEEVDPILKELEPKYGGIWYIDNDERWTEILFDESLRNPVRESINEWNKRYSAVDIRKSNYGDKDSIEIHYNPSSDKSIADMNRLVQEIKAKYPQIYQDNSLDLDSSRSSCFTSRSLKSGRASHRPFRSVKSAKTQIKSSTRSLIGITDDISKNDTMRAVYCHYDGYLSGVGYELYRDYNSLADAKDLISHGSLRSPDEPFDEGSSFIAKINEWEDGDWTDYHYIFDRKTNQWYVSWGRGVKPLRKALAEDSDESFDDLDLSEKSDPEISEGAVSVEIYVPEYPSFDDMEKIKEYVIDGRDYDVDDAEIWVKQDPDLDPDDYDTEDDYREAVENDRNLILRDLQRICPDYYFVKEEYDGFVFDVKEALEQKVLNLCKGLGIEAMFDRGKLKISKIEKSELDNLIAKLQEINPEIEVSKISNVSSSNSRRGK